MIECMADDSGNYYKVDEYDMIRIKQVLEALATDGFPCPPEMADEAKSLLTEFV